MPSILLSLLFDISRSSAFRLGSMGEFAESQRIKGSARNLSLPLLSGIYEVYKISSFLSFLIILPICPNYQILIRLSSPTGILYTHYPNYYLSYPIPTSYSPFSLLLHLFSILSFHSILSLFSLISPYLLFSLGGNSLALP